MKHIPTTLDTPFSYFDTSAWFAGVVESIHDPLMQGRVQVRCIGYHPDSKTLVPTADLPWAHVMLPTTSAGVSGIGATHGLVDGSWVIGFFSDGREAQQPIVIGTIPGNPKPSRIQSTLINSGQSISTTASDGISGLTQSVSLKQVASTTSGSYGPSISDASTAIDLSSYSSLLSSGLSGTIVPGSSVQANSILSVVSSTNDIRASQIYDVISSNEKIRSNAVEGYGILSYIGKYSDNTLASLLGVSSLDGVNINAKAGTVDVNTNYEKALDDSDGNVGLLLLEHNNVRKSSAGLPVSSYSGLSNYHFVVTAQGQVFPKTQLNKKIVSGDNLETVTDLGTTSSTIRICLIGGLPDDSKYDNTASFAQRFTTPQMNATKRLLATLLKKYPKAVINGANDLSKDGSGVEPNFDVSKTFKDMFPANINTSSSGSPVIAGTSNIPVKTQFDTTTPDTTGFHDPRGIYPAINYGQDYSAIARYNGISTSGRLPPAVEAIKGNLTKFSTQEPRNASNRTAVGINPSVQVPAVEWAGEYGMSHVIRETPGGHGIYADDTTGKERFIIVSPTGSVFEIRGDGTMVQMAQGDLKTLVHGNYDTVVNSDMTETINGNKKVKIAGDFILEVGGRFAIVSGETNEFVQGNKTVINEGFFKQQSKAGHIIEVGKDYNLEIGGNKTSIVSGTVVDQAGMSRSVVTTGMHSTKSNYSSDTTLGNRYIITKGNLSLGSNGDSDIFSKGDFSLTTAGKLSSTSTGASSFHANGIEISSSGKLSLNGASGIGINSTGGNITLDGSHYSIDEGTIADHTNPTSVEIFDFPATLQPVAPVSSPESNPSASNMTYGNRQEMEAHDEMGGNPGTSATNSSINAGVEDNTNSSGSTSNYARSNMDTVSLGSSASSGCTIASGLVTRGMSEEAASAYAGGFMQESGFNPTNTNSIGAYGLAQWTNSGNRKNNMLAYTGSNSGSVDAQLDYVLYELKNNPGGAAGGAATTWQTSNLADAIKSAAYYERFNGFESAAQGVYAGNEWGNRAGYAASIYKDCFNKDPGIFNPASNYSAGLNGFTSGNSTGPNTGIGSGPSSRGSEQNITLPPLSDKYTDRNQKISEFFTLADLLQSGGNKFDMPAYVDTPSGRISADDIVANMSKLAVNVLDVISRNMGKVTILSGLRSPAYNASIGGAKNSQHLYGRASDIVVAGYSVEQVKNYVDANIAAVKGHGYYPGRFNHLDIRPQPNRTTWNG